MVLAYPLIPWVGVMAVGFACGALYQIPAPRRQRLLLWSGVLATVLFFVLRAINIYGDPSRWSKQKSIALTVISFFNATKYPPSLLFLLMTLGPAMLLLALFERREPKHRGQSGALARLRSFFITFGRVPLFFYLLQWPTAHFLSVLMHLIAGKPVGWMFNQDLRAAPPAGVGFNLAVVYACWLAGVLLLYPLCKWFAGVKQRRRDWWLSYL